jgi:predicted secreted protein
MERTVRRGEPQTYAQAVGDLWERVGTALVRLERIAEAAPDTLAEDFVDELPTLQYSLHSGAELAVGIAPPVGAEGLHHELVAALAEARDATAEIALALDAADAELVEPLLPEWRGVLFRVRLARLRALERTAVTIGTSESSPTAPRRKRGEQASISAVVATLLVVGGAFLFTAGAVLAAWPVWAAGLGLFAGGFVLYRP